MNTLHTDSPLRVATVADIPELVRLSDLKRTEAARHQPLFWRKAENATQKQAAFFQTQLQNSRVLILVAQSRTNIEGFVIAEIAGAPPVYDPGGLTCLIDDFCVSDPTLWKTVGRELLRDISQRARERGAVQIVVVCGRHEKEKQEMLQSAECSIASEWWTGAI